MNSIAAKSLPQSRQDARQKLRVLLAEDNVADGELVMHELRRCGFDVIAGEVVKTRDEFRAQLRAIVPEVVLADYNLGQWRGMDALEIMREEGVNIPLILVSGALGDVTAVECIKQGATDYVLKDSLARLPICIRRALEEKKLREERAFAQEELKNKAAELARSNADLEQFAYAASHDLQEPLRMVTTYSQLLAERYFGKLDDQADKYIHYAVDGALRMQTLIQDLLAFSRAGRQETEEATDCNQVVQSGAVEPASHDSARAGRTITQDFLPEVVANSSQLQQVFQNLIGNALKFRGPDPPEVRVSAEQGGRRTGCSRFPTTASASRRSRNQHDFRGL